VLSWAVGCAVLSCAELCRAGLCRVELGGSSMPIEIIDISMCYI
jgi:hypothetical protein